MNCEVHFRLHFWTRSRTPSVTPFWSVLCWLGFKNDDFGTPSKTHCVPKWRPGRTRFRSEFALGLKSARSFKVVWSFFATWFSAPSRGRPRLDLYPMLVPLGSIFGLFGNPWGAIWAQSAGIGDTVRTIPNNCGPVGRLF